ncbi:hypothetical protein FGU65_02585 [Methanoculleus sp. FWC-SCC1]|uniref:Uncharacterized protein n=1 Tax=Methanoculleus frigidifontis TaxID=2584085 RepID=A0ABT8M784_9EURY|nr:hypothetical protein [Methanoculleus sp. FWC-SCC1]MDN7023793.1 hypothetical protein [Methanoculleus sp. FWC-SCC1]
MPDIRLADAVDLGRRQSLYVNDRYLDTVYDSMFSSGYVALSADSVSSTDTTVAFDNLEIEKI